MNLNEEDGRLAKGGPKRLQIDGRAAESVSCKFQMISSNFWAATLIFKDFWPNGAGRMFQFERDKGEQWRGMGTK